jgi:hypothetical protein
MKSPPLFRIWGLVIASLDKILEPIEEQEVGDSPAFESGNKDIITSRNTGKIETEIIQRTSHDVTQV